MSGSRVYSLSRVQTEQEQVDVPRLRLTLQGDVDIARRGKTHSVYEADVRVGGHQAQDSPLGQLQKELAQFKEVRHSMEVIREHFSSGMNGILHKTPDYGPMSETAVGEETSERMREATRRWYDRLKEAEGRHVEEVAFLQDRADRYRGELAEARESLRLSQENVGQRDVRINELQRLMAGMEVEQGSLVMAMREGERRLMEMRGQSHSNDANRHRTLELEGEVDSLREKISHLGDMLQSQQRKVRQMIEQLQASRSQIEEKDVFIQRLQEQVEHLESENRELQDRVEFLTNGTDTPTQHAARSSSPGTTPPSSPHAHGNQTWHRSNKPKSLRRVLESR